MESLAQKLTEATLESPTLGETIMRRMLDLTLLEHPKSIMTSSSELLAELNDTKRRHERALHELFALRAQYLSLPAATRSDKNFALEHRSKSDEAFEDSVEVNDTFTGTMLEATSQIVEDGENAVRR